MGGEARNSALNVNALSPAMLFDSVVEDVKCHPMESVKTLVLISR